MKKSTRLKIAIQKSGKLNSDSLDLLFRCGLKIRTNANSLLYHAENLPIDVLLVRDDDIPTFVMDGVCDLGIVGENVLLEKTAAKNADNNPIEIIKPLGFGRCRLSIAMPQNAEYIDLQSLKTLRIATTYPNLLQKFLEQNAINAAITPISGSVEITPRLGMVDAICDLVSTGRTLEEHGLKEVVAVIQSQAVLIKTYGEFLPEKQAIFELLLNRINGVIKANESKYIMFHAPKHALASLKKLLPGFETPTIMPLEADTEKVAVHVVSSEGIFWNTLEKLKAAGASSILVLPIEKMMD